MSKVYLFDCDNYENSQSAIEKVINSFPTLVNIKKGTKVVIKVNLVSALSPDKNATVNPILLKHLCSYLISKGASVVIGDSPGGLFNNAHLENVYKITGMKNTGAILNKNFSSTKVNFAKAKVLKNFEYTSYLDEADILINFSKLKTHAMMAMSACVKNLFGTIPGTLKPEYHYRFLNHEDFANMLIDLNEYFKIKINIIDGVVGMQGNGPTCGTPKKIGIILASENPYALDYVASKIINLHPENVMTIKKSIERGLFDPSKLETNDNVDKFVVKNFENIQTVNSIEFFKSQKLLSGLINKIFETKPKVCKKECIGCGKCAKICPKGAITMKNNKPFIDCKKCIKCFCCQEFCPKGAMKVKKTIIAKILQK